MELLMIILNKEKHLGKILSLLVELEVSGATILDSKGSERFLAYEVPIFAGLRQLIGEKKTTHTTILALIEEENFLFNFKRLLNEEDIDFTQPGTGAIFTLPVNDAITSQHKIY